ncbi:hypothetical protein AVEN_135388-1 [Araneus ventricosus]|uniref:Uncharacterized protein n=1 Tax=Araneus ventricosus TaxID=182803 RepID=A0A4Y2WLT7_ARAVE|nr:hypothetical protein AVEN_135388-1 [Araneus ventricosus]
MKRATPELEPHLQISAPHQPSRPSLWILNPMGESVDVGCGQHTSGRTFDPLLIIQRANRPNTRRIICGIGFETWNPPAWQSLGFTTAESRVGDPIPLKLDRYIGLVHAKSFTGNFLPMA